MIEVRRAIMGAVSERYETGRINRQTYRNAREIAAEAAKALGEEVPDTALGADIISAWLAKWLEWQYA